MTWVSLDKVELRRRGRTILGPVSFALGREGVTVVMGPNGAGKTSLLRALHGLERVSSGTIHWADGTAHRGAQAFIFQTPTVMRRSVLDNIAYPLRLDGVGRGEARARAEAMAAEVGLKMALTGPAAILSGGETQKMALARALIRHPDVLFLDECSANLDGRATYDLEQLVIRVRDAGTRIVMSSHDIGQARRLADDVVFLHDGKLVEHAKAAPFFDAPRSEEAKTYLKGGIVL